MATAPLWNDVRQFFAYSVLRRFNRVEEADVQFTFDHHSLYLSSFYQAFEKIQDPQADRIRVDAELLRYAQVFERFAAGNSAQISRRTAALISAAMYWLSGYSANARVIAALLTGKFPRGSARWQLARLLSGSRLFASDFANDFEQNIGDFLLTGDFAQLSELAAQQGERTRKFLTDARANEFTASLLVEQVLRRLRERSIWSAVDAYSTAPRETWRAYLAQCAASGSPVVDLWPSQYTAIEKGLLDSSSSLVLRMPTSAGKTKLTELAFVNDLASQRDSKCLYLAPFRALVAEVERSLGRILNELGHTVVGLHGGAETNEIEIALTERARVLVATPEKLAAVLRATGRDLSEFQTIVLDEGHLLDSGGRGVSYEFELSRLLTDSAVHAQSPTRQPRTLFLSAVLPNAEEIAEWLGGSTDRLAENAWHPTTTRIGVLHWRTGRSPTIEYQNRPGEFEAVPFFVPRVLEPEEWEERYPETGRNRKHYFPKRGDQASITAALAFEYAKIGPIIAFAQQPAWVEAIAKRILERLSLRRPIETNLVPPGKEDALAKLSDAAASRLGDDALIARSLRIGVGIHHGKVPHAIRLMIEDAFRKQQLRLLIATTTVAQGVNFPAKTVLVHSLPREGAPVRDFWNLVGRAGRALQETEGEVVILGTGSLPTKTLQKYLSKGAIEPARSQLLRLVEAILDDYPIVDADTLRALLEDPEKGEDWKEVVQVLDSRLLEVMAEELDQGNPEYFDALLQNLFATRQAVSTGGRSQELSAGITNLLRVRLELISDIVPSVPDRQRFAATGLSPHGALAVDGAVTALAATLDRDTELSAEVLTEVFGAVASAPELADFEALRAGRAAIAWMTTGSYSDVRAAAGFEDLESAIGFVESTFGFSLPWLLDGLLQLWQQRLEADPTFSEPPEWLILLPQYLQYGVSRKTLVWMMSLGMQDPQFAEWLESEFVSAQGRQPLTFREMLRWAIDSREQLTRDARAVWPAYYSNILGSVLRRYERVVELLDV